MVVNRSLYEDNHPSKSLKGLGFKNKDKAIETINIIKPYNLIYQKQVITTMFNRAKFHPYRTEAMVEAMKVFAAWMKKYKIRFSFN